MNKKWDGRKDLIGRTAIDKIYVLFIWMVNICMEMKDWKEVCTKTKERKKAIRKRNIKWAVVVKKIFEYEIWL